MSTINQLIRKSRKSKKKKDKSPALSKGLNNIKKEIYKI